MNLFEFEVGGVKIWEQIRVQFFNAISRRSLNEPATRLPRQTGLSRIKRLLFSVFQFRRNPFLSSKADIMFICSARRLHENDGIWWDIYTDPIMDAMKHRYTAFESHFLNEHYRPEKTTKLRYFDFVDFLSFVLRSTRIVRTIFTQEELRKIRLVEQSVLKDFEVKLDFEELVRRTLEERKIRLPLYKFLIKRVQPHLAILAQGYGWETMIEACRASGVPTIELQHGIISPESVAYSFPGEFRKKETFTDYLFVFGDFWKSAAEFPIPLSRVASVGYPHFERKRRKYSKLPKQKQILFISQGPVGVALSHIASELSVIEDFDYKIKYKLHPLEREGWREKYPWLVSSKVEVLDQKEDILYKLFAESTIQVGVYSTALYEGLGFALRTYIFDAPESIHSKPLYEGKLATKFASTSELRELIEQSQSSNQIDIDYIFKSHAIENLMSAIEKITRKKWSIRE